MTLEEFRRADPASLPEVLRALWLEGNGDWEKAHIVAQDIEGPNGAWVHAYLHRKEGDNANAAYWYRRAGRAPATGEMAGEWETMVRALLRS